MSEAMGKARFIGMMRSEREQWEGLLAELDDAQMVRPGVAGDWSAKDVIAHVTAYERGLVEWLEAAARGESLTFADLDHPDLDHRNTLLYARNQGRPLDDVLLESNRIFERLMELVESLSEEELTDPARSDWYVRPRWKESRPLWECIADDSVRHYRQHVPGIQAWLNFGGR